MDVSVDGDGSWDPDEGGPAPAVVLRMPPYVARHLACVLDDWSTIGRLLESARGGDERDLAGVLYEAARAADSLRADGPDREAGRSSSDTRTAAGRRPAAVRESLPAQPDAARSPT